MSDRFYKDIEIPNLTSGITLESPDMGFIQVYGKNNKLTYQDSNGKETILTKEIYINEAPPADVVSIVFQQITINGQLTFQMKVNDGIA